MKQASKVAYLGPPGTFSQTAVLNHFGEKCALQACNSIDDAFAAVGQGDVDYAVVPVENSTEGMVNNTQDCLVDTSLVIVGEEIVPIEHQLMLPKASRNEDILIIASHKQSLAQCRQWLQSHYPDASLLECASNAEAARLTATEPHTAAIAGRTAATIYGLDIIAENIQDQQHNSTRFLILGQQPVSASGHDKTSILVYASNRPGALFYVLEPFENLKISLTKIDSRPSKRKAWEYVFFIDFEGHREDDKVIELFGRLQSCTEEVKVLGSYPAFAKSQDR